MINDSSFNSEIFYSYWLFALTCSTNNQEMKRKRFDFLFYFNAQIYFRTFFRVFSFNQQDNQGLKNSCLLWIQSSWMKTVWNSRIFISRQSLFRYLVTYAASQQIARSSAYFRSLSSILGIPYVSEGTGVTWSMTINQINEKV